MNSITFNRQNRSFLKVFEMVFDIQTLLNYNTIIQTLFQLFQLFLPSHRTAVWARTITNNRYIKYKLELMVGYEKNRFPLSQLKAGKSQIGR